MLRLANVDFEGPHMGYLFLPEKPGVVVTVVIDSMARPHVTSYESTDNLRASVEKEVRSGHCGGGTGFMIRFALLTEWNDVRRSRIVERLRRVYGPPTRYPSFASFSSSRYQ